MPVYYNGIFTLRLPSNATSCASISGQQHVSIYYQVMLLKLKRLLLNLYIFFFFGFFIEYSEVQIGKSSSKINQTGIETDNGKTSETGAATSCTDGEKGKPKPKAKPKEDRKLR